jgi:hypothetical protein
MSLDLTDEETTAVPRELDGLIDGDRYFLIGGHQDFESNPRFF